MVAKLPSVEPANFREITVSDDRRTFTLCRARPSAFPPPVLFLVKVNGHCVATPHTWLQAVAAFRKELRWYRGAALSFFWEAQNG